MSRESSAFPERHLQEPFCRVPGTYLGIYVPVQPIGYISLSPPSCMQMGLDNSLPHQLHLTPLFSVAVVASMRVARGQRKLAVWGPLGDRLAGCGLLGSLGGRAPAAYKPGTCMVSADEFRLKQPVLSSAQRQLIEARTQSHHT